MVPTAHTPVLLQEVITLFGLLPGNQVIDCTLGGGGHARELIQRITPGGSFLGIDIDKNAVARVQAHLRVDGVRTQYVVGNYRDITTIVKQKKFTGTNGILLDLGFSSDHLEDPLRGFSFNVNGPLDMRYDDSKHSKTAADIVNRVSESTLTNIFRTYGEERYARIIARALVKERRVDRITTTKQLADIVTKVVPQRYERGRIHPATRIFQALRIAVNDELGNLETFLKSVPNIIAPQGKLLIITYHSLEVRTVRHYFRELIKQRVARLLTKKPIVPTREEIESNRRSRSAQLWGIEFKNNIS